MSDIDKASDTAVIILSEELRQIKKKRTKREKIVSLHIPDQLGLI
jgi:hypothetical protein